MANTYLETKATTTVKQKNPELIGVCSGKCEPRKEKKGIQQNERTPEKTKTYFKSTCV